MVLIRRTQEKSESKDNEIKKKKKKDNEIAEAETVVMNLQLRKGPQPKNRAASRHCKGKEMDFPLIASRRNQPHGYHS